MPEDILKRPCAECPWRRDSAPGWLGASNPEEFLRTFVTAGTDPPCHMTVDYESPRWQQLIEEAPRCKGNVIFMANHMKSPRNEAFAADVRKTETDREEVFTIEAEFLAHHKREPMSDADAKLADVFRRMK